MLDLLKGFHVPHLQQLTIEKRIQCKMNTLLKWNQEQSFEISSHGSDIFLQHRASFAWGNLQTPHLQYSENSIYG